MAEQTFSGVAPTATPAGGPVTAALSRATDRLLDAANEGADLAEAAAAAAVAELADWCAVDIVGSGGELCRVASAAAREADEYRIAGALALFGEPDDGMLRRLALAAAPIRFEDPDWLPEHRVIAAAVGDGEDPRGAVTALLALRGAELADQLWFTGELGRRLELALALGSRR